MVAVVGEETGDRYQNRPGAIEVVSAKSNPTLADTDGDGLNDSAERRLGTDAMAADSDGDGVRDAAETAQAAGDPTMYDVAPPTVTISRAVHEDSEYSVDVLLTDPSGVQSYDVLLNGETEPTGSADGATRVAVNESIEVGVLEEITNSLGSTKLQIEVADAHGNEQRKLLYSSSNLVVETLKRQGLLEVLTTEDIYKLGIASGSMQSIGELTRMLQNLVEDPREFLSEMANVTKYVQLARNIEDVPGMLVKSYQRQMNATNPFYDMRERAVRDGKQSEYEAFEVGYYTGVVVFEVAASVAGGASVLSKVKKVDTLAGIADANRVQAALSYYRKAKKVKDGAKRTYVTGPATRLGGRMATKLADGKAVSVGKATEVFRGVKTVGKQWQIRDRVREIPSRKLQTLSSSGRENLGKLLDRLSRPEAAALGRLDRSTLRRLVGDCGSGNVVLFSGAAGAGDAIGSSTSGCGDWTNAKYGKLLETVARMDRDSTEGAFNGLAAVGKKLPSEKAGELGSLLLKNKDASLRVFSQIDTSSKAPKRIARVYADRSEKFERVLSMGMRGLDEAKRNALAKAKSRYLERIGKDLIEGNEISKYTKTYMESIRQLRDMERRGDVEIKNLPGLFTGVSRNGIQNAGHEAYKAVLVAGRQSTRKVEFEVHLKGAGKDIDYARKLASGATRYVEAKNFNGVGSPTKQWVREQLDAARGKFAPNSDIKDPDMQDKFVLELGAKVGNGFTKQDARQAVSQWLDDLEPNKQPLVDEVVFESQSGSITKVIIHDDGSVEVVEPRQRSIQRIPIPQTMESRAISPYSVRQRDFINDDSFVGLYRNECQPGVTDGAVGDADTIGALA